MHTECLEEPSPSPIPRQVEAAQPLDGSVHQHVPEGTRPDPHPPRGPLRRGEPVRHELLGIRAPLLPKVLGEHAEEGAVDPGGELRLQSHQSVAARPSPIASRTSACRRRVSASATARPNGVMAT